MPITRLRPTFTFDEERLAQLRAVAPEAFADGKINWETLHEALGDYLEDESPEAEHFGLLWPGKRQARRLASLPSHGALVPVPGEGVDEATTRNIFIEGENLEALKLLRKAYAGRVKMIFIDPPYNTGNDHVYTDDYAQPIDAYLRRTGQADEAGLLLTTNTRASGRFHSNWLNMIYPRLILARQLLAEDGAIFVSIDDNEVHNLRLLMDEVFGPENFLTQIEWQKRYTRSNNTDEFTSVIDHILLYQGGLRFRPNLLEREAAADARYANPDNDPRGPWKAIPFSNPLSPEERPNLVYGIGNPHTGELITPTKKAWRSERAVYDRLAAENRIWWGHDGTASAPSVKRFLSEVRQGMTPINLWDYQFAGHTDAANAEIKALFEDKVFDTPKPTLLAQRMLQIATAPDEGHLILDFFAGSCSTAHAVHIQNREDGGNRRFVMVQLAEPTPSNSPARKAGYTSIADIGKERIRRAIAKLKAGNQQKLGLHSTQDLGFRCYRLHRSHFRRWHDYEGDSPAEMQTLFDQFETPLVDGWIPDNLLVEIMLLEGFPLDSAVTPQPTFAHNTVQLIPSDWCDHRLFVCLDPAIHDDTLASLSPVGKDVFVCLDSSLTDEAKLRLADACDLKVI